MFLSAYREKSVTVRLRNGVPVPTSYHEPITVIKYIHDAVVVITSFGTFIISENSVAYIEGDKCAIADIKREGGRLRFEPRPEKSAEELKDIIRAYLPESLPPQLTRRGNKIYLGEAEVATIYELT
jgi:hypothetical protein